MHDTTKHISNTKSLCTLKYGECCIACSFYNFLPTKVYKKRIKNNYVKVIITLVATSRIIFTFSMNWNKQEKCSMSSSRAQCLNVIMLVKYTSAFSNKFHIKQLSFCDKIKAIAFTSFSIPYCYKYEKLTLTALFFLTTFVNFKFKQNF